MRNATRWHSGDWASDVYARLPAGWIASADRVVRCGTALARRRLPVTVYEGTLADGGGRGRVAVVDEHASVRHFVQRLTANWAFAFERAQQLGVQACHMGLSRPALNDGVLVYKKRWDAALNGGQPRHFDLFARCERYNPTVARLLRASPLLFHDGNGLSGLTATEAQADPGTMQRLAIDLAVPGMERLYVMTPDGEPMARCELTDDPVRDLDVRAVPATSSARLVELLAAEAVR